MTWTRTRDRTWQSSDPIEVEEMRETMLQDELVCQTCIRYKGQMAPYHATSYINGNRAMTYHCPSLSRWYNPQTKQMEGRAHCTCDYCW